MQINKLFSFPFRKELRGYGHPRKRYICFINGNHKGSRAVLARIQYNIKVLLMYDISKCNKIRGLGAEWPNTSDVLRFKSQPGRR